jgi:hypothetical protein
VKKVNKNKDISRVPVLIFCLLALSVGFIIFAISPFVKANYFLRSNQQITNGFSEATSPTPAPNKTIETVGIPTHVPSPQPTPIPREEMNPSLPEMTSEEVLNNVLGSPDWDCDGILNSEDNCIFVYNPNQKDGNKDGKGNACAPSKVDSSFLDSRCDMDGDGITNHKDNCPSICNPDQKFVDINENKVNDLCDSLSPNFVAEQSCSKRIKVKAPKRLKSKSSNKE